MGDIWIDNAPIRGCKNMGASFGEICVKCNKCGRFDEPKETEKKAK